MAGYGRFETVEQLASSGPFTLYSARPAGETKPPELAIKVYEGQAGFLGAAWERKVGEFLGAANLQRQLVEKGAKHWAPIYAAEATEEAAYYVTKLFPLSAKKMTTGAWQRNARDIGIVVAGAASGLLELRDMGGGRGHGNLHSGNVLIESTPSDGITSVSLIDPSPKGEANAEELLADQVSLGRLIFELVMRREAPKAGGFSLTQEWTSLGAAGKVLHDLADSLMSPQKDSGTLEQLRDRLLNLPASSSGGGKGVMIAAAVVVLAGAGALVVLKPWEQKKQTGGGTTGGSGGVVVETPTVKTGACVTFDEANKKWIVTVVEEAECATVKGRYWGDGSSFPFPEYLADPRVEGWPGKVPKEHETEWEALRTASRFRKDGLAEFNKRYDAARTALDERIAAVLRARKWVPGYAEADTSLPPAEQQRLVDECKAVELELTSFAPTGERLAQAKAAIDALPSALDPQEVTGAVARLAAAEAKIADLAREFGDELMQQSGYRKDEFDKLRSDLQSLQQSTQGVAPTEEQIEQVRRVVARVDAIPAKLEDYKYGLEQAVKREIAAAEASLSSDLPEVLVNALRGQISRLEASTVAPPEKIARAKAAGYWAEEIRKAFEIPGISGLDSVFDKAVFERLKGDQSKAAVESFATTVAALSVMPARDDAAFAQQLASASATLRQWGQKVSRLAGDATRAKTLLEHGYGMEDPAPSGESIKSLVDGIAKDADWNLIRPAFKPLEDAVAGLARIATLNPTQLVAELPALQAQPAPARLGTMLAAWNRLTGAGSAWPETFEQWNGLPRTVADLEANIDASACDSARKTKLKSDLRARRLAYWVDYVSTKATADQTTRVFAPETREAFGVTDKELGALSGNAAYNWALLRAKAEVATLQDAGIGAFISTWRGPLSADDALKKAFDKAADGKFGTEWSAVGPMANPAGGWALSSSADAEDHAAYTKNGQTIRFNKVPGTETMMATTEVTVGLVAVLLEGDKSNFVFGAKAEGSPGVTPWFYKDRKAVVRTPPSAKLTLGWMVEASELPDGPLYADGVRIEPPVAATPLNLVSPTDAAVLARGMGCRLPTVGEWGAARGAGTGSPNVRDGAFGLQCNFAQQRGFLPQYLPSANRFPMEGSAVNAAADCGAVAGNDGVVFFRAAPVGSDRFVDLEGNVAEWVLEKETDIPAGVPIGQVDDLLEPVVGVIGGSAFSPPAVAPDTFVKGISVASLGFKARSSNYSDVGFRLAFTAEGGGGGNTSGAEWMRRKLDAARYK